MAEVINKRSPIRAEPAACTGCLICELRCSLRFEKEFNPSKAALRVRRRVGAETEYEIEFSENCDACGICARHCPYGALAQEKEPQLEAAQGGR